MPTKLFRTPGLALSLLLMLAVGGCASLAAPADQLLAAESLRSAEVAAAAEAARAAATRAQSASEPQYLRFRADETQLAGAQDDGRITYLEFVSLVTTELEFFDQDGRQLTVASAGRVAAIDGLHQGLLVRRADRASFLSPNPRALSLPRRPLPDTADYGEARAKLENQGDQLQAMQRAMEAVSLGARAGSASARAQQVRGALPALQSAQAPPSSYAVPLPIPLAVANASSSAPERGLVRVFFATASRAIVAPDDGLGLLLREAANADEIRVSGFTDATGARTTNDALALARADAVVQILLRRGIPGNRIFSSAVGAADYLADNTSDKGRALNRRVEVLLLRNGVPLAFGAAARAMR